MNFKPTFERHFRAQDFDQESRKIIRLLSRVLNFFLLQRISGSKKMEKREKSKKKKRQASSLTDRIIEEIGFVFDRGDCSRLFKLHHHTKITLYVTMECSTDGEHIAIASNIRDRFASYGWTCNILSSRAIENRYPSTNLCYQSRVTDKSNTRVTIKLVKASGV